jgi:antirestriction protein ArdC
MTGRRDQKLSDVEADAASAYQCHALAHRVFTQQHVDIAQHGRVILSGDARVARRDASGQNDFFEFLRQ